MEFLLKDHLLSADTGIPESQTDVTRFSRWWRQLPDKRVPLEVIKEIAGRYSTFFLRTDERCEHLHRRKIGASGPVKKQNIIILSFNKGIEHKEGEKKRLHFQNLRAKGDKLMESINPLETN